MRTLGLGTGAADALMPMHLWAAGSGKIRHVGPALQKLVPDLPLEGERFGDLFAVRRPRGAASPADLAARGAVRVSLDLRPVGQTMQGVSVPTQGGSVLLNLSLGIGVVEAVGQFGLTAGDFAASDPTVEMLYLVEAQEAVLAESRRLNRRLDEARTDAEARAVRDALTGLGNRRALDADLAGLTEPPADAPFGLMHIDLDFFKEVNDTLGHAAGDAVLRHVADILRAETRTGDLVSRVGGDEFVVICRNCSDLQILDRIASRINARLAVPIRFHGQPCRVSASIGLTLSSQYDPPVAADMLRNADLALYESKRQGRACHNLYRADMSGADPGPIGRGQRPADWPDAAAG